MGYRVLRLRQPAAREAYAIFFLMPLFICVLAVPFLGEPIDLPRGLAVLAGLIGVIIALRPGVMALQWAHLAALGGGMIGALYYLILRKTGGRESMAVIMLYPMHGPDHLCRPGPALRLCADACSPTSGCSACMAVEAFLGSLFIVCRLPRSTRRRGRPDAIFQIICRHPVLDPVTSTNRWTCPPWLASPSSSLPDCSSWHGQSPPRPPSRPSIHGVVNEIPLNFLPHAATGGQPRPSRRGRNPRTTFHDSSSFEPERGPFGSGRFRPLRDSRRDREIPWLQRQLLPVPDHLLFRPDGLSADDHRDDERQVATATCVPECRSGP